MVDKQNIELMSLLKDMADTLDNKEYRDVIIPQMEAHPIYLNVTRYYETEQSRLVSDYHDAQVRGADESTLKKLHRRITLSDILRAAYVTPLGQAKLTGTFTSFSSFNGRATAEKVAMMSLPKSIKKYLYVEGDYNIYEFDLANAEIAAAAVVSKDEVLIEDLAHEEGIYVFLVMSALNLSLEASKEFRPHGKAAIIQLTYGARAENVIKRLIKQGMTEEKANRLVEFILERYKILWTYLDKVAHSKYIMFNGKSTKFSTNLIQPHKLPNYAIASVVACTMKEWTCLVNERYTVILTVHDSIWIKVKPTMLEKDVHEFIVESLNKAMHNNGLYLPNINVKQNKLGV